MLIITNPDAQILAAEAGELDILSDIARPSDIDRLGADPKLKMSLARGMHAFFLLLNNKKISRGTTRPCAARRLCRWTAELSCA